MPSGQRGGGPQDPRGGRGGRQWSDQSSDRVRRIERAASERDGAPRHPSYDDPRYADGHEEPLYAQPVHDDGYGEQYDDGYGDAYAAPSYGAPTHVRSAGWDRGAEQSWGMAPGYSGGGYSRRPAVHDAWRPRRQLPPFLPTVPTLLLGLLVVILAFVLGRATGGGGGEATVAAATDTTVPVTTVT